MYVRQMQNGDEDWLLEQIGEYDLNEPSFRSRDYVLAVESGADGDPCGFGRVYQYTHDDRNYVKFAQITVLDGHDTGQARSLIYKSLFQKALDYDIETAYVVAQEPPEVPFDFEECNPEEEDVLVDEGYDYAKAPENPRLFRANVLKALDKQTEEERISELADEFGFDDDTTTKYSID